MNFIKLYVTALIIFFVLDLIWLGIIAKSWYQEYLGFLMAERIRWGAVIFFYLIYLFGLIIFVVWPSLEKGNVFLSIVYGGLFGFICYATYNLTNLATLRDWPFKVVIVDLIWGTSVTALTAFITNLIGLIWK